MLGFALRTRFRVNSPVYHYANERPYSVLLLDDEPDVTLTLKKGLERQNVFSVDSFNDPIEALNCLSDREYDIMIVDIRLPKMDGFEFYQHAQRIKNSKVVFITASDRYHEEYQQRFPEWNGNCFILKPISISILSNFLLCELGDTRATRENYN